MAHESEARVREETGKGGIHAADVPDLSARSGCEGEAIVALPCGWTALVTVHYDETMGEPWKEHDGHGPVSDWTARNKRAGERILARDGRSFRYYDVEAATKQARAEGWGCGGENGREHTHLTKRTATACAVYSDFRRLEAWCNDDWYWIYVQVQLRDAQGERVGDPATCGGIESDSDYWKEIAVQLIDEAADGYVL